MYKRFSARETFCEESGDSDICEQLIAFHSDGGFGEIGINQTAGWSALPLLKASSQRSVPNSKGMVCIGLSLLVTKRYFHGVGA